MKPLFPSWLFAFGLFSAFAPCLNAQHYEPYEITSITSTNSTDYVPTDGIGTEAHLILPLGLAVDSAGTLFIADYWAHSIRQVRREGTNWVVSTIVTGLNSPEAVAVDPDGSLYVTEFIPSAIRKVTPVGTNWVVTRVAGLNEGSADGTNTDAQFRQPCGIAVGPEGNLYAADEGNETIRKLTPMGTNWVTTTIAGLAGQAGHSDGTNSDARFNLPYALAVDGNGNLYVADSLNSTIRKIVQDGTNWIVTTIAGRFQTGTNGRPIGGYADGAGTQALFNTPVGLAFDRTGNLFVSDGGNAAIRKMTMKGTNWVVTTLAGGPESYGTNQPLYNPGPGFADGIGSHAILWGPTGIGVAANGQIFIADAWDQRIRMGQIVPTLRCMPSAGQPVISWPTEAIGYVLETSGTPTAAGPWTPLTNGIVMFGNNYFLTNDMSADEAFFRLHKSPQ